MSLGRSRGVPVDALLEEHGIRIEPLENDPAYMSGEAFERLLSVGFRALPYPLPGLAFGMTSQQTVFGLNAYLAQTASTIEGCVQTIIQAEPLLGNVGTTTLRHQPGEAHLVWYCRLVDPYVRFHVSDFIFSTLAHFLNACAPGAELLQAVHFTHAPPRDASLLERYQAVFACPVHFDQPENRIVMHAKGLELTVNSADPKLNAVLSRHAQSLLEERSRAVSFTDRVCLELNQLICQGNASREALAASLEMTSRTLHRKLQKESTSYRELLDRLRLERACALLRETAQPVQAVANDAGFDEAHSFARWFRQLTGLSPTEYREQPS
ncbi:AraC family transcriptional regulator [Alcanivorax hongdengensis A-11-3]|uniref:AraC family transcriptional regulator n=2 Tax=Alcanivorax hongdengensis TaxID=519051 RepID=L0W8A0_9GAMM|nr:AraC family transcriptional regulator [Alcanivorax hongdengensis A-11-3]